MKNKILLAESELDIMQTLWNFGEPMRVKMLVDMLGNRTWKTQTAHVLLKRLEAKGFIAVDRSGYFHLFSPVITEREYLTMQTLTMIHRLNSTLVDVITSLLESDELTKEDLRTITRALSQVKDRREVR